MTSRSRRPKSVAEWVTLTLSGLIVGALVAVAVVEEQRRREYEDLGVRVTFASERAEVRGRLFRAIHGAQFGRASAYLR